MHQPKIKTNRYLCIILTVISELTAVDEAVRLYLQVQVTASHGAKYEDILRQRN
jgi:hypothetical protein